MRVLDRFCHHNCHQNQQNRHYHHHHHQGLGRDLAYSLAAQTMVGAGRMVLETGDTFLDYQPCISTGLETGDDAFRLSALHNQY